jgi:Flp pilus assembly protein TadD
MSKPFRAGSAVSLVALAAMFAGCAAPQQQTGFGGKANGEVGLATRAMMALNAKDIPTAISFAERAVERNPDDAGFRALLGNSYFAAGRFHSAEDAYKDALSIYSNQPQVLLKLVLAEIALGKNEQAIAFLQQGGSVLDPADYGLALALAGRSSDALSVLESAARAEGADARVRQNLALAYAFAGDWSQSRTVAAQDVPANLLDGRIQQWMQLAKPAKAGDQVASLVGVTPVAQDQGQPVRLALHKSDTRLAEAAPSAPAIPVPVPMPVQAAVTTPVPALATQLAQSAPVTASQFAEAPPFAPAASAPQRPVARDEAAAPVTMALMAAASKVGSTIKALLPAQLAPAERRSKVRKAAAPRPSVANSTAVVQLGAYGSPQRVAVAWTAVASKYAALRAYRPMSARFADGRGTFYRLSVHGFDSLGEANALCASLHRSGANCFVRNFAGDRPVQYASR